MREATARLAVEPPLRSPVNVRRNAIQVVRIRRRGMCNMGLVPCDLRSQQQPIDTEAVPLPRGIRGCQDSRAGADRVRHETVYRRQSAGRGRRSRRAEPGGANLRGHDSHGVMRIPQYLGFLDRGEYALGVELKVDRETPGFLVCDAQWGLGQVQANSAP